MTLNTFKCTFKNNYKPMSCACYGAYGDDVEFKHACTFPLKRLNISKSVIEIKGVIMACWSLKMGLTKRTKSFSILPSFSEWGRFKRGRDGDDKKCGTGILNYITSNYVIMRQCFLNLKVGILMSLQKYTICKKESWK